MKDYSTRYCKWINVFRHNFTLFRLLMEDVATAAIIGVPLCLGWHFGVLVGVSAFVLILLLISKSFAFLKEFKSALFWRDMVHSMLTLLIIGTAITAIYFRIEIWNALAFTLQYDAQSPWYIQGMVGSLVLIAISPLLVASMAAWRSFSAFSYLYYIEVEIPKQLRERNLSI